MKFCGNCGQAVEWKVPPGDHAPRHVCGSCGHVHYQNPKLIVGCVPEWEDGRILMCKRNIQPRHGYWTFPAGFLEMGETCAAGAARETLEESNAAVEVQDLLAVLGVPHVSQVYMIYRARLLRPEFRPTPESSEVRLMSEAEIPWDEIAFPTVYKSLRYFFADRTAGRREIHVEDLEFKRRP